MKHLIDKSALVAEIERRISLFKKEKKTEKCGVGTSQMNVVSLGARIAMLEEIKVFLNTLEVKELDLEKNLSLEDYNSFFTKYPDLSDDWGFDECWAFAQYFFELGLKAKGE